MTALIIAAFLQPEDMIELLLDNGADPNQKSCRGFSPLIAAGKNRHEGVVTLLKTYGAEE